MSTAQVRVHFPANGSFQADLKRRAEQYFEGAGRSRQGGFPMLFKTLTIVAWLAVSWALLVFAPVNAWQAALLSVSVGLAIAGIGFSVMHDANHGSYSSNPRINQIVSFSLDLIGASSFLWRQKHNLMHHTFTNISGVDADIETGSPMLRLAPWQPRLKHHRFQHVYVWLLYGVFPLEWWFVDDLRELASGRIAGRPFPKARGWALTRTLVGKAIFVAWAFLIPVLFHPTWKVIPLFALGLFVLGNVIASVFQLAHCVSEADFLEAPLGGEMKTEWAEHQVNTTVDFARKNKFLSWYLGGLNYQVEHHLFPRVCHLHYPALSALVEESCAAHGIRYRAEPSLVSALSSNVRWLRLMGSPA